MADRCNISVICRSRSRTLAHRADVLLQSDVAGMKISTYKSGRLLRGEVMPKVIRYFNNDLINLLTPPDEK